MTAIDRKLTLDKFKVNESIIDLSQNQIISLHYTPSFTRC